MKDYFNKAEQSIHLCLLACQKAAKQLKDGNAPTEEEKTYLKYICTYIDKLDDSICSRMGEAYENRLRRTSESSKVVLVRDTEKPDDLLVECDYNFLKKMAEKMQSEKCWLCDGKNHTKCDIYNIAVTLGLDDVKYYKGVGCPFKDY